MIKQIAQSISSKNIWFPKKE